MKKSEVYLKAAKLVHKNCSLSMFSCLTIDNILEQQNSKTRTEYWHLFSPDIWYITDADDGVEELYNMHEEDIYNWRLTALCLAAEMAKTGDI